MKIALIAALMLSFLLVIGGCNKDKEISDLENEIKESESSDLLEDQTATTDTMTEATEEVAMTPETAPVEEEPEVKEMPSRPEGNGFTVQVAAGSDYDYVTDRVNWFSNQGYNAFMEEAVVDGVTYYRVRIGVYPDIAEAKTVGDELKDKYSVDYWIDNN